MACGFLPAHLIFICNDNLWYFGAYLTSDYLSLLFFRFFIIINHFYAFFLFSVFYSYSVFLLFLSSLLLSLL